MYLAIQSSYTDVQMGLFKNNILLGSCTIDKFQASKECVTTLQNLLKEHTANLEQLSYIVVNKGPAPFTTLRVVIATVNGLALARPIPLVGVDAFQAYRYQYQDKNALILFNAFGNDLYYHFPDGQQGAASLDTIVQKIKQLDQPMNIVGNGARIHKTKLLEKVGTSIRIPESAPYCSLDALAHVGFNQWQKQPTQCRQILPLYLKNLTA